LTDLAAIERYAIAIPLRVAAEILSMNQTSLRRQIAGGKVAGVKLGDQWFIRRIDFRTIVHARGADAGAGTTAFARRWAAAEPGALPAMLDIAEVELLLAERRILLYRLLAAGSLHGERRPDGWAVSRDALLAALAPASDRELAAVAR
jgi:hypothetical protein